MGFFESTFNPCLITITVQWYKRSEQPIVSAIWQSMFAFGTTIQSLIAYGMFNVRDTSLRNWQWVVLFFAMLSAIGTGECLPIVTD
jgi:MFS family permease